MSGQCQTKSAALANTWMWPRAAAFVHSSTLPLTRGLWRGPSASDLWRHLTLIRIQIRQDLEH